MGLPRVCATAGLAETKSRSIIFVNRDRVWDGIASTVQPSPTEGGVGE